MGLIEVYIRTNSHNSLGVDLQMTLLYHNCIIITTIIINSKKLYCECPTYLIVVLNVESISGVSKSRGLVEISQVAPQVGVVYDTLLVTLKKL